MRGRKRKPTAIKQLEGNPGRRPLPQREPKPPTDFDPAWMRKLLSVPAPPDWGDREASGRWVERVSSDLYAELMGVFQETPGLFTRLDRLALEMLCTHYGMWRRAYEIARQEDPWHPASTEMRKQAGIIRPLLAEFGIGPASRARIEMPGEDDDDLDNF